MANMKRQHKRGRPEVEGLADVLQDPKTEPIMRAIAEHAVACGETLGSLARRLNALDGTNLAASNVRKHFATQRVRETTVNSYASALGVSLETLYIVAGHQRIGEPAVSRELKELKRALLLEITGLEVEAIDEARAYIDQASAEHRAQIATQYLRSKLGRPKVGQIKNSVDHIVAAFDGLVELQKRKRQPNEDLLFSLWLECHPILGDDGAEALVSLAVGLLRRRNFDTAVLEERLIVERAAWQLFLAERLEGAR